MTDILQGVHVYDALTSRDYVSVEIGLCRWSRRIMILLGDTGRISIRTSFSDNRLKVEMSSGIIPLRR